MLSADFGHLERDTQMIDRSAAEWVHIDVMDGVFVPNISFGFPVMKAIRKATSKLNTEIEALISEKNAAYNTYRTAKAEHEQLATAKRNTEQILHGTPSRQKKHEQER